MQPYVVLRDKKSCLLKKGSRQVSPIVIAKDLTVPLIL